MNRIFFFLTVILILTFGCKTEPIEKNFALIPAPASIKELKGDFVFSGKTRIIVSPFNEGTRIAADLISQLAGNPTGFVIGAEEGYKPLKGSVFLTIDTAIRNSEGYYLKITQKNILIKAGTSAGLFYAAQTLRQLMPVEVEKEEKIDGFKLSVPACEISDEPEFSYRGILLDVARHMFPAEDIKRYIDILAMHKINKLQLHLTDDQGWRIEIKKYPGLSEKGAFRKETLIGHAGSRPYKFDGTPYGGFYTQDQIRDLVAYASKQFITIIPEIEMPGHGLAALTAYPHLSCTGGPFQLRTIWGVEEDVFCAGNEETFVFLEDVLTEVMDLFPSEYIHIGGDECPKVRWEKCPACQKRIRNEDLNDEKELQSYLVKRIEKFLNEKGRRLIGWDEILEGGLAPEAIVMSWRGIQGGIEAARQKHDVIMTPNNYAYLDYYQAEPQGEPLAIGGYLPLEKVYMYDPLPSELNQEEQKHIIGFQGNLWTEYISTPDHMQYMTFPRAFAIAETGWTPERLKDFPDFLSRFNVLRERYDKIGLKYFKGEYYDTREAK